MKTGRIGFLFLFALILCACGPGQALSPAITPSPTRAPVPTATAIPAPTAAPIGIGSGKILFTMANPEINNNRDIFILDMATGDSINLTRNESEKQNFHGPSASPDGKKIAYGWVTEIESANYGVPVWKSEIFIMDVSGENIRKISTIPIARGTLRIEDFINERNPAWSSDGKRIAFVSNRWGLIESGSWNENEITVFNIDTNETSQLTSARGNIEHPAWSPNGSQIAFTSDRDGDWDIYTMNADGGGNETSLMDNTSNDRHPSWSNSGRYLVYHSDRGENYQLYLYDFGIGEESQLTTGPGNNTTGRWSPDDAWVVFVSDRDGGRDFYIIQVNTREEIRITDNNVDKGYQSWIP